MKMSNELLTLSFVSGAATAKNDPHRSFALYSLGIVDLLEMGLLHPSDAEFKLFNAHLIQFAKKKIRNRAAVEFLERGSQLADLFDAFPKPVAKRELARELKAMRALSVKIWTDNRD